MAVVILILESKRCLTGLNRQSRLRLRRKPEFACNGGFIYRLLICIFA